MTNLSEILDVHLLDEHIKNGLVSCVDHPHLPLRILNYTPRVQFDRLWDDVTRKTRGLIVDYGNNVVARPFEKFFNYGEVDVNDLPLAPPLVYDKVDGSLGIIYPDGEGGFNVATRGSFMSEQAKWATEWLHATYPDFQQPSDWTTLVEIVYPENRIVVDYSGWEGLIHLSAVHVPTGEEVEASWWPGQKVVCFGRMDLEFANGFATSKAFDKAEGVVLSWPRPGRPSTKVKVKHPRYVELHRIVTGLSTRTIWESLMTGAPLDLNGIPDEFHGWIENVTYDLNDQHENIVTQANEDWMAALRVTGPDATRKDMAAYIQKWSPYPGLVFALLDGKDISEKVWKMCKPERECAMIIEDGE